MSFRGLFSSSFPFFLFFLLFATNGLVLISSFPDEISGSMKLELIHRNSRKLSGNVISEERPKTQMENLKQLYKRDVLRHRNIVSRRRKAIETGSSMAMPMHSGSDYGTGEYFVHVHIGTPGQNLMLVADTGSELTWMKCRYNSCGRRPECLNNIKNDTTVFQADRSDSFRTVACSSKMCKVDLADLFSISRCPSNLTPCAYDYSYLEGSAALGFFASETLLVDLTDGVKRKLTNVLIGCTESVRNNKGTFKGADGVLGLGFGKYTFTSRAAEDFGGKFSYCLVDHLSSKNESNYIVFGHNKIKTSLWSSMKQTDLVMGRILGPFYGVDVFGISIGGLLINIPPAVWSTKFGGGTILDSGTSLTFLAEPAYQSVTAAFNEFVSGFEILSLDEGPFDICFNSSGYNESLVPRLRIHFENGALFEPPVKSYILDVAPWTKCLGFVSASWPGISIIGNIMQQNHLWEFDLEKNTVGFAPSSCT